MDDALLYRRRAYRSQKKQVELVNAIQVLGLLARSALIDLI